MTDLKKIAEEKAKKNRKQLEEKGLPNQTVPFLPFYESLSASEKGLVQAWNDRLLEQAFTIEDALFYDTDETKAEKYNELMNTFPQDRIQSIEQYLKETVGSPYNWHEKELTIYDVYSSIGHYKENEFSPQIEQELPKQTEQDKSKEKEIQKTVHFNEKREAIDLYAKFLQGESLTYDERSKIVAYDQKNNSFEQMQYRLEAIDVVQEANPEINLSIQEEALCHTRGEQEQMLKLVSAEYYQQSTSEKKEQKQEEKERKEQKKEKALVQQLMM